MIQPAGGANHDGNSERRNFAVTLLITDAGTENSHRDIRAVERFVAIEIYAGGNGESVFGRELMDEAPHLAVTDDGEVELRITHRRPPDLIR